ncbi:hypothetical protein [Alistipes sp.]|uniref:hypothetical protein n=1 Tax=Alistipes sp. TaxID=1872444 RepID=UPI003AEF4F36
MQHLLLILPFLSVLFAGCTPHHPPVEQRTVERIETMPSAPERFRLADWRQIALDLDRYLYDFDARGEDLPLIWLDSAQRNVPIVSYGLYTALGDRRQGPDRNNGEHHEAIGVLGSIYGATLAGIDKSRQQGMNWVRMCQNYFNSATGWNIVMNNTCPEAGALGGGYGRDFWYDIFPNMLFYAIGGHYPDVEGVDPIMRTVAERFTAADSVIMHTVGSYRMREFDFGRMQPGNRERMVQSDAAAGFAYVLYGAWCKYGDPRYLRAAQSAMNALNAETASPFYEVIMPFAVYLAARMNAEQGTAYDVAKFLDWTFDGQSAARPGWGVLTGRFGSYAVDGLCGSVSEEYAFAMNTFALMWPLLPAVRYDQSFARAVGRWAVNAVGNARYFYPQYVEPSNQSLTDPSPARGVIAYEGFRRYDKYADPRLRGVEGIATGDGPQWVAGNPQHSMLSIYGSAYAGIFGATVRPTNIEKILQLDCTATDLFARAYPTYLYYNPYGERKSVRIDLGSETCDLYDIVSRSYLCRGKSGVQYFDLAPDTARVVVLLPAGGRRSIRNGVLYVDRIAVDFRL